MVHIVENACAGHRFDAAYTGGYRRFRENLEETQLRRVVHMGAAAQLSGEVPGLYHTDHIAVLLAEQSHSPHGLRLGNGHFPRLHRHGRQNDAVDDPLHVPEFLRRQAGEMGKVKPGRLFGHHLARLLHMVAQNLAQRRLQKMGCGMVSHDGKPPLFVHCRCHRVSHAQNAAFHGASVNEHAGCRLKAAEYPEGHAVQG